MTSATDDIIPGDVVRHTNTHLLACVVKVGRTCNDGTIEYEVRPAQNRDGDLDLRWWNSSRIWRVPRKDPYRRYLALVAIEDDPTKQERRQKPASDVDRLHWRLRARRFGPWLHDRVWDGLYWKLSNTMRHDPSGAYVSYSLGREQWQKAAIDCLKRRDRAAHWWMRPRIEAAP